jgi:hypothetical protein
MSNRKLWYYVMHPYSITHDKDLDTIQPFVQENNITFLCFQYGSHIGCGTPLVFLIGFVL